MKLHGTRLKPGTTPRTSIDAQFEDQLLDLEKGVYPVSRLNATTQSELEDAITSFGSNLKKIMFDKPITFDTDYSFPDNIDFDFLDQPQIEVNTGITVTINTEINEGNKVLFTGDGNVVLAKNKYINGRWFNLVGDGTTNESSIWNKLGNNSPYEHMYVPKPAVEYRINNITINNLRLLEIEPGTVIKGLGQLGQYETAINVINANNLTIHAEGVTFKDLRDQYQIDPSNQFRHGIRFMACNKTTVHGLRIESTGGDGFYIGSSLTVFGLPCKDIKLINCSTYDVARNGLSIISCINADIVDCNFSYCHGVAPQSGIDCEPNNYADFLQGIRITNLKTSLNYGAGMLVSLQPLHLAPNNVKGDDWSENKRVDITIDGHTDDGSDWGVIIQEVWGPVFGTVNFTDCYWSNNVHGAFLGFNYSANSATINVVRPTIINPISATNGFFNFKVAVLIIRRNVLNTGTDPIGNIHFIEPIIEERRENPQVTHAFYYIDQKSLGIIQNCTLRDPKRIIGIPNDNLLVSNNVDMNVSDKYGVLRKTATTNLTINDQYVKTFVDNLGASGLVNITIANFGPFPITPRRISFEVRTAQFLRITPIGSNFSPISSPLGGYIQSNVIGSRITVEKRTTTSWYVTDITGTWYNNLGDVIRKDDLVDVMMKRQDIVLNSDLNSYTVTGIYNASYDTLAASLTNRASAKAGRLLVFNTGTNIYQWWEEISTGMIFWRSSSGIVFVGAGWKIVETSTYFVSATYNPPSIAAGDRIVYDAAVTPAVVGQRVEVVWNADLMGLELGSPYVSAPGNVKIPIKNPTLAAVDLPIGFFKIFLTSTP